MPERPNQSEQAFEAFLENLGISFNRVGTAAERRPDYEVTFAGTKVLFEVKQIESDIRFGKILKSRTVGDHVRSKISEAKKQLQWAASKGKPAILVIYNVLDPMHLFGTEDHDFEAVMFGEHHRRNRIRTGRDISVRDHRQLSRTEPIAFTQ